jgi:hypothetical protein
LVEFIKKRLQVFISSTYTDLRDERQAAVEAILSAGHIPAGMELFAAGDESQMEVIKQWIDESDVYLLILGGCYGSIDPKSGRSYTELEYQYALSKGKPLFSCVVKPEALDAKVKRDGKDVLELENPQQLKEFRALVLTKISKFFSDSKDIKIAVVETLANLARREELGGWVRANEQANVPALASELARLSQENARLRSEIPSAKQEILIGGIPFSDMKRLLAGKGILELFRKYPRSEFQQPRPLFIESSAQNAIQELEGLNLVEGLVGGYRLTKNGLQFLIALEADDLKPSDPANS